MTNTPEKPTPSPDIEYLADRLCYDNNWSSTADGAAWASADTWWLARGDGRKAAIYRLPAPAVAS